MLEKTTPSPISYVVCCEPPCACVCVCPSARDRYLMRDANMRRPTHREPTAEIEHHSLCFLRERERERAPASSKQHTHTLVGLRDTNEPLSLSVRGARRGPFHWHKSFSTAWLEHLFVMYREEDRERGKREREKERASSVRPRALSLSRGFRHHQRGSLQIPGKKE